MALPLRIRTHIGEPPHGILLRLSARHKESNVREFAADCGLSFRRVLSGHDAARLANLAGVDQTELARFTPKIDARKRTVELAGDRLLLNDWSIRTRRWCPICLDQDRAFAVSHGGLEDSGPWHRALWDIRSVSTCPDHKIRLLDFCAECGVGQDFTGPSVAQCRCGADLSAGTKSSSETRFSAFVAGRLGLGAGRPSETLDKLNLKDAIPLIERLGDCAVLGHRMRKPRQSPDERAHALEVGIIVAENWPAMFLESLDRIVGAARAAGASHGMTEAYGWVYQGWIAAPLPLIVSDLLRPILRGHAAMHGLMQTTDALNATKAAQALEMGYARARPLLVARGLITPETRQGFERNISIHAISALKNSLKATIDVVAVGKRLGTAKTQTRAILATGLLTPLKLNGRSRYRIDDVDRLLKRLTADIPVRSECPESLLPLPKACRAAGVGIAQVLSAIASGSFAATASLDQGDGLRRLLIDPTRLNALFRRTDAISIESAASMLHVHHEAARNLVRLGVLGKHTRYRENLVTASDVLNFEKTYVPATTIAHALGVSVRTVVLNLRDNGIAPAFCPPSCRQIIFAREKASRVFPRLLEYPLFSNGRSTECQQEQPFASVTVKTNPHTEL